MNADQSRTFPARAVLISALALSLLGNADAPHSISSGDDPPPITFDARAQTLHFDGAAVEGMTYNGDYAGPVLRIRPGQHLKIHLINHLTKPTNLHFHGMQTSPLGHSDNVFTVVQPGEDFLYDLEIPPYQPPGLYWYHAHLHGIAEEQVRGGLSGALIIEGLTDKFAELAGIREDLFVLKDIEYDDSTDPIIDGHFHELIRTINGKTMSHWEMRPGETKLWRFSNQSSNLYYHLSLTGHHFKILAEDGVVVQNRAELSTLDIKPAGRIEALVTGGAAGVYDLVALKTPTDSDAAESPNRVLGHLTIAGPPATPKAMPTQPTDAADLSSAKIDMERRFVFSESKDVNHYMIDGKEYDHTRIDTRVPLGNIEEWTIRNATDDMHVFHIHQVSFQLMEINGQKQPFNGQVDVIKVPERGEVKIRLAFTNPRILGRFVYHCHVLKHEDKGMMANIEVYDPKAGTLWPAIQNLADRVRIAFLGLPATCGFHGSYFSGG